MIYYRCLLLMLLVFPGFLAAQNDSLGTAFFIGYGARFANETTGMQVGAGYQLQFPIGKQGVKGGLKATALYSVISERIEEQVTGSDPAMDFYSRKAGQYYIFNLGLTGSLGYGNHFVDFGLDAQLWQFRGIYLEEYNNQRWEYARSEVDRYLGAVLGYSYNPLKGFGISAYWNPQLDFLDRPRTELRKENYGVLLTYSF